MSIYAGKNVVVTGAGSGIGRCLCEQLAEQGANVIATDINKERLQQTVDKLSNATSTISGYELDVSKRDDFFQFADHILNDVGHIDYVFNNAGVTVFGTVEHLSIEDYEWLLNINLWGVIYGTKAFLPNMLRKGTGHIVNISSMYGFVGIRTQSAYNTSKFAVRGFTESLARELEGSGVYASSIHPGGISTNIAKDARFKDGGAIFESKEEVLNLSEKVLRMPPENAAKIILKGVAKRKRRVCVGLDSKLIDMLQRIAPVSYGKVLNLLGA